jgi:drug/metabolite transporter (DMT)-like permease
MNGAATPPMMSPRILIPFAIITLIWGSTWLVITGQIGTVSPSWSVTYRFLIGGVVMLGYAWLTRQPLRLGPSSHAFAAAFGFAQFVFNFNFVYRAEQHITSGLVAVVFALLVVPNALLGRVFLGIGVSKRFIIGSVVAFSGVAMLFANELRHDTANNHATLLGIALTVAGVMSASMANIMQATKRAKAIPMATLIGWGMLWGTAINACFSWITTGPPTIEPSLTYVAGLLYLGVMASAVTFTLYFGLIRKIGPAKAAYSNAIVPIIAMGLSTVFENYRWTLLAATGGIITLIGMFIALSAARSKPIIKDSQPASI